MTTAKDTISADSYFQDFDGEICRAWLSRKTKFRDAFHEEGNRKAFHILHQLVDLRNTRKVAWAKESEKFKEKLAQACGAQKAEAFINAHDADDEKEPDLFKRLDFWINQALTHEFDDQTFDDGLFDALDNGFQASPGPLPSLPSPESTTQSSNPFSLGAPVAQMDLFEYPPKTTNAPTTGVQLGSPVTQFPSQDQDASTYHQQPPAAGQQLSYSSSNETSEKPVSLVPCDTGNNRI
jgi:hypothetical protein